MVYNTENAQLTKSEVDLLSAREDDAEEEATVVGVDELFGACFACRSVRFCS